MRESGTLKAGWFSAVKRRDRGQRPRIRISYMQSATPVAMIDLPTIDEYGVVSVSLQYLRLHAAASSSRLLQTFG